VVPVIQLAAVALISAMYRDVTHETRVGSGCGSFKNLALVTEETGVIRGLGRAGPGNHQTVSLKNAIAAICSACMEAFLQASVQAPVEVGVFGLGGVLFFYNCSNKAQGGAKCTGFPSRICSVVGALLLALETWKGALDREILENLNDQAQNLSETDQRG